MEEKRSEKWTESRHRLQARGVWVWVWVWVWCARGSSVFASWSENGVGIYDGPDHAGDGTV